MPRLRLPILLPGLLLQFGDHNIIIIAGRCHLLPGLLLQIGNHNIIIIAGRCHLLLYIHKFKSISTFLALGFLLLFLLGLVADTGSTKVEKYSSAVA
jgi:hypothetical protein